MTSEAIAAVGAGKSVWDMLLALLKGNAENKGAFFEHHVQPLQDKLIDIHKDYTGTFQEVRRYLRDSAKPPISLIDFLRERQSSYSHERQMVIDLATEIAKPDNVRFSGDLKSAVVGYCNAILAYFGATESMSHPSWYTYYLGKVQRNVEMGFKEEWIWDTEAIEGDPQAYLLREVDSLLDHDLPRSFQRVSETYAKLKVHLV